MKPTADEQAAKCSECNGTGRVVPWVGPKRKGLTWPCPRCTLKAPGRGH